MLIRETTIDDLPQIDLIRQATEPWHVATVETQRVWFESNPPEAKVYRVCAEIGGRIVGNGWAKLDLYAEEPHSAVLALGVHPDAQRQGVGTALHQQLEDHLREIGARQTVAELVDGPGAVAFAEKQGYVLGATNRWIVVDPRVLPAMPEAAPGVTVKSAREAGPQAWYDVTDIAARDEPGDVVFGGMPYEDWLESHWKTIDLDLSMMAFVDNVPAATSGLNANYATNKAMSAGSDCLREFRGRGIVKLIKSVSLRAAAEQGITAAYTGNNMVNAPMRAINAWLGYDYVGSSRSVVKKLV